MSEPVHLLRERRVGDPFGKPNLLRVKCGASFPPPKTAGEPLPATITGWASLVTCESCLGDGAPW